MISQNEPSAWIEAAVSRMTAAQARRPLPSGEPLKAVSSARAEKALLEAGVGKHHIGLLTGRQALRATTSMQAVKAFASEAERWCLILAGSRGVGKSLAASWHLAECLTKRPLAPLTRRHIFSSLHIMRARRDSGLLQVMLDVDLLVLDDLGVEVNDHAGLFMWCLFEVINFRWENRKRTVVTTNVTPRNLEARYGRRVTDRLRDGGRCVIAKGTSLRGK